MLGPLLFNLFINDFFYARHETNICNYADDNTLHICGMELENLMKKLESAANAAISWFKNNSMKMNSDKSHLLVSGHKHEIMIANIGGEQVIETHSVKPIGTDIDSKLSFNTHLKQGS